MKKIYMQPKTDVCETLPVQMLAASGVTGSVDGGDGPGWGGSDDTGEIIPGVKENNFEFEW